MGNTELRLKNSEGIKKLFFLKSPAVAKLIYKNVKSKVCKKFERV